jgi:Restriction endonuclease EcoRII, N-terminal
MTLTSFAKLLSANDVGLTGGHQAGIHVPKGSRELLAFFPFLDPALPNPDAWISALDDVGTEWVLRFVYYNNRLHGTGTRNEYRITHLTKCLRDMQARPGDQLVFSSTQELGHYLLRLERAAPRGHAAPVSAGVIQLCGWRRVH